MKIFPLHLIPNDTNFDFMRLRWVSIGIALLMFLVAAGSIAVKGFNEGLDFTGGVSLNLHFEKPIDVEQVRNKLDQSGYAGAQVQTYESGNELLVRLQTSGDKQSSAEVNDTTAQEVLAILNTAENPGNLVSNEFVGSQVGKDLTKQGMYAALFVLIGFLIYIGVRFEWKFAISAIITTLFDVLIVAGWFSISGMEFDLTILAGLLSVMGFSINDTIVVFDRVRENFRTLRLEPMEVLNRSINQTLSRTIITSLVFFLSVLALYIFGGDTLEGLALSQMIGAVVATLSSIFVACPLLTWGFLTVTKQDLMVKTKDDPELDRRP